MSLSVTHNLSALFTQRAIGAADGAVRKSLQQLASGYRINTGADGPADLIISEKLRAQVAGLERAIRNTQEAYNLLSVTEGALDEMSAILRTARQLALHSLNHGVTSPQQVAADQSELDSSLQTIDRIANTSRYDNRFLLNGASAITGQHETLVNGMMDAPLLDSGFTRIHQMRDGQNQVRITFAGTDNPDKVDMGDADMGAQARKAYFEIDSATTGIDLELSPDAAPVLSADQVFTLGGNEGSRTFTFSAGTRLSEVVESINRNTATTGVEAALIFNSDQTVDVLPYPVQTIITDHALQTDAGGGDIPIFPGPVQGLQNVGGINVGAGDRVSNFDIVADTGGLPDGQVRFRMRNNLGNTIATQVLNVPPVAGTGSIPVTLTSANGTSISFDYQYGSGGGFEVNTSTAGLDANQVRFELLDDAANVLVNQVVSLAPGGGAGNSTQNVTLASAEGTSISFDYQYGHGGGFDVVASTGGLDPGQVRLRLIDDLGATLDNQVVNLNPAAGGGNGSQNVTLASGNGTSVNFNYHFGNGSGFDVIAETAGVGDNQVRLRLVDDLGNTLVNQVETLNTVAGGGNATKNVTLTTANGTSLNFDYRYGNGADFRIVASTGGVGANQVRLRMIDNLGNTLANQVVNLAVVGGGGNGTRNVTLTSANGTSINFDYQYGNNGAGLYDRATGDLMVFDAGGAITDNGLTTAGTYAPVVNAAINLPPAATVDANDTHFDRGTGNLLDFNYAGAITNNGITTAGTYAPVVNAATGLPPAATVDADDTHWDQPTGNLFDFDNAGAITDNGITTGGVWGPAIAASDGYPPAATVDGDDMHLDRPTGNLLDFDQGGAIINNGVTTAGAWGPVANAAINLPPLASVDLDDYNWDLPLGNLLDVNEFGVVTDNGLTTSGTYAPAVQAVINEPANIAVDAADLGEYIVSAVRTGNNRVTLAMRDTFGNVLDQRFNWNLPLAGDIATRFANINFASANGTTASFRFHYENDPLKFGSGASDFIEGQLFRFDRDGNIIPGSVNNAFTNGRFAANVTTPTDAVNAAQNIAADVRLFDVVNGETPFEIEAVAGPNPNEVTFLVHATTTDPLITETIVLPDLPTAGTGFISVNLETPNRSTIDFDYYYENDPSSGEFDRPEGILFDVAALLIVDAEQIHNGLSPAALAAGAQVDINFDPLDPGHLRNTEYGRNTDAQGRIFFKILRHDTATRQIEFELYKSRLMEEHNLVAYGSGACDGSGPITLEERNGSRLGGDITFDDNGGAVDFTTDFGPEAFIAIGGILGTNGTTATGGFSFGAAAGEFETNRTTLSGIVIGENTDRDGKLYIKTVQDGANSGQVFAYRDFEMGEKDLVAVSEAGISLDADTEVILNEVRYGDGTTSGFNMTVRTNNAWAGAAGDTYTGTIALTDLGVRITSTEYGEDAFVEVSQEEGRLWQHYPDLTSAAGTVVDPNGEGVRLTGANAEVYVDDRAFETDGLDLKYASLDGSGELRFNAGKTGELTIAQVGYLDGTAFTNAGFLTNVSDGWNDTDGNGIRGTSEIEDFKSGANLVNAGHRTTEVLIDLTGGLRLQLGEGAGTQERTILGITPHTITELGRVTQGGSDYALQDVLGGGDADLAHDAVLTLEIIDTAIRDVAETRARLGAWQKNLLQTNRNNLEVALERTTDTESAIRDTNMATAATERVRSQILRTTASRMLVQADAARREQITSLLGVLGTGNALDSDAGASGAA